MRKLKKVANLLMQAPIRYGYLLRIPLLTGVGFAAICVLAFSTDAKSLMAGAFDINSTHGIFWVSLLAFLFSSAVEMTWRLIRCYGPARFFDDPVCNSNPGWRGSIGYALLIALVALPPIGGAIYGSTRLSTDPSICEDLSTPYECTVLPLVPTLRCAFLGFIVYLGCIIVITFVQLLFNRPDVAERSPDLFLISAARPLRPLFNWLRRSDPIGWLTNRIIRLLGPALIEKIQPLARRVTACTKRFLKRSYKGLGRGYLEYRNGRFSILPGHTTAFALFLLTGAGYLWIGNKDFDNLEAGMSTTIPTLGYVLLLFTLLCWGLSGLTFILDRYRIPVLVPIILMLLITSFAPWMKSDFYYPVTKPAEPEGSEYSSNEPMIVVAATGGGIQSAAWTARVLTGLEKECRRVECAREFDESIRLISPVSGGSVGTMYFVNEYKEGRLPESEEKLEEIVARAEKSSLDYVLWGLLYPDLVRLVNLSPTYEPKWDRGRALEQAWARDTSKGINEPLSKWRNDTRVNLENSTRADDQPARPAVIFNTTVTETGGRLPFTTTEPLEGRPRHENIIGDEEKTRTDVSVVTATRLSAAFPYVSPAARADVDGTAAHLVDGGYYDNYGIVSLVEWLDAELESNPDIGRVLVVEIRDSGGDCHDRAPEPQIKDNRGWVYQAKAPPQTVLNVRDTAQRANNEVTLNLLIDKWDKEGDSQTDKDVDFTHARFSFDGPNPPTSWHLTESQKRDIHSNWKAELEEPCNSDKGWKKVKSFLDTQSNNE